MENERGSNNNLPAIMVIFGGTGDLTSRKLMPALYNLVCEGLLPEHFAIVSVGRQKKTDDHYRAEVYEAIKRYSCNEVIEANWHSLSESIYYVQLDFLDSGGYLSLQASLEIIDQKHKTCGNRIFYLAVAPEYFEIIVHGLHTNKLVDGSHGWQRLVIEKPFGRDLSSAKRLNNQLSQVFSEQNIYRIDHYLGKEMIQNIMVLRFCNSVFESVWSNKYIDNIQILLSERAGIGSRGGYYETAGAMRDMVQNHILQTLSLVAMEPPVSLNPDAIRSEKLKVIQAIEPFESGHIQENVIFGQYGEGSVDGNLAKAYRAENKVAEMSTTETFVAMKLHIQNFRWAGTPFYIRTGKRLGSNEGKIVIQFKPSPPILYLRDKPVQEPNVLVIKIQPQVGVFFQFSTKRFGASEDIVSATMDTSNDCHTNGNTPEAYERLIVDILRGDTTLFSRWDEVEAAWGFVDKITANCKQQANEFPNYAAGSMGPVRALELVNRDGRKWWD
ncbi:glucose-6-phosphate 1-dehydrogenase [Sporomusaceae bacterium FL31]|nr:glucose-6-phosphate 1-dehydrogenase [Sporomusaceae bacterium FL31]GCE35613.1 glucose-6-phosphate 1-dehydrogenase [Sporomusaceae bacterium]